MKKILTIAIVLTLISSSGYAEQNTSTYTQVKKAYSELPQRIEVNCWNCKRDYSFDKSVLIISASTVKCEHCGSPFRDYFALPEEVMDFGETWAVLEPETREEWSIKLIEEFKEKRGDN